MPTNGRITITNVEKTETYELNGLIHTVGSALERFYGDADWNDEVKLNGRDVADFDAPLRDGDVIILTSTTVAGGGVKGAAC